jgi:N-acetylmuramoyl-L-alanine amidase
MNEKKSFSRVQDIKPERVNMFKQLLTVFSVGIFLATMFTAWTPLGLIPLDWADRINQAFLLPSDPSEALEITPTPRPRPHIGIVSGHWGNDSGAVCPDGLTEAEVNLDVASLVKQYLIAEGYEVDLLREFDDRLYQYRALALVSIHADSCEFVNNEATGYKVSAAWASERPERANRLAACINARYSEATGQQFHPGSITTDMTSYHAFEEIHEDTTAVIIETGFLNLDRQILTQHPDLIARGITNGILCFINNESVPLPSTINE